MQRILFVCLLVLSATCCFAQTASLTKGETIAYLDKKMKEAVGHTLSNSNGLIGEIVDAKVAKDEKGIRVEFNYKGSNGTYYWSRFVFNPATIESAEPYTNETSSAIAEISIKLIGNTSVTTSGTGNYAGHYGFMTNTKSSNYVNFLYLRADPENLKKIKKALLYLKSLVKAEDDPFAN